MTSPRSFTSPCKGEVGREAAGRGSKRRFSRTEQMTKRARSLRSSMTDAEAKLWRAVRRDQINNLNFRRQHPVGPYTLDFYCPSLRLGIELDGGQHAEHGNRLNDQRRTRWLASKGILVIRFWNNDVLGNLDGVLTEILRVATERLAQVSTPSPTLPLSGGGRREAAP
jgi:very-short-patch-repair endonuclease